MDCIYAIGEPLPKMVRRLYLRVGQELGSQMKLLVIYVKVRSLDLSWINIVNGETSGQKKEQ